jgi:TetR/AcrR family acrAB operon transcriptional repressor
LLLRFGYDKTTVSDIAAEAHVSKGAVYLHYASKEALVEALVMREAGKVQADIMQRMDADPEGGRIHSIFRHALVAAAANPLMRAFYGQRKSVYGSLLHTLIPRVGAEVNRGSALDFIKQFQSAGLLRADVDPPVLAHFFAVIRYGLLTIDDLIPESESPSLEAFGELLADIFKRALEPTTGGDIQAGKASFAGMVEDAMARMKETLPAASPKDEGE